MRVSREHTATLGAFQWVISGLSNLLIFTFTGKHGIPCLWRMRPLIRALFLWLPRPPFLLPGAPWFPDPTVWCHFLRSPIFSCRFLSGILACILLLGLWPKPPGWFLILLLIIFSTWALVYDHCSDSHLCLLALRCFIFSALLSCSFSLSECFEWFSFCKFMGAFVSTYRKLKWVPRSSRLSRPLRCWHLAIG